MSVLRLRATRPQGRNVKQCSGQRLEQRQKKDPAPPRTCPSAGGLQTTHLYEAVGVRLYRRGVGEALAVPCRREAQGVFDGTRHRPVCQELRANESVHPPVTAANTARARAAAPQTTTLASHRCPPGAAGPGALGGKWCVQAPTQPRRMGRGADVPENERRTRARGVAGALFGCCSRCRSLWYALNVRLVHRPSSKARPGPRGGGTLAWPLRDCNGISGRRDKGSPGRP